MVKPGQRRSQRQLSQNYIIKSKTKWYREALVGTFTLIVWVYCLGVIYFFLNSVFSPSQEYSMLFEKFFRMNNVDIRDFLIFSLVLLVVIYLLLDLWSYYNRKRYGNLARRQYPDPTTKEDLMSLDLIDETTYEKLQKAKIVELKINPVRIPSENRKKS